MQRQCKADNLERVICKVHVIMSPQLLLAAQVEKKGQSTRAVHGPLLLPNPIFPFFKMYSLKKGVAG